MKRANYLMPQIEKIFLIEVSIFLIITLIFLPSQSFSQSLQLSYSYLNLTRNNGGGTLEQGDTIEIHALAEVNATTRSFYYIDTIPTGTQYISNSLKLMTNEGVLFPGSGPYTDASNDDAAVYNSGIPAVRINIGTGFSNAQTGAGFGAATGGGTVTAGSVPKFYGSTLFIVSYKLLVTDNYGDTIHPTGNYYFDTTISGTHYSSFRFNYPGIKIIHNQGLCNNYLGASFSAESSFGSGNTTNRSTPATVPGYTKINIGLNNPSDNYYSIVNNTSANGTTNNSGPYKPTTNNNRVFGGFWDIIGDHTNAINPATGNSPVVSGQTGSYMLVVNASFTTGEAYRDTIRNLCPNTYYEFSAWIRNMCGYCGINQNGTATYTPGVLPNLSYAINDIDYYTTGNIQHDTIWEEHGFLYKTGPTETSFRITIKNNAAGGGGNDWVLDDINLVTCYPNLINSPKDTATSCANVPISLSDTVKSYFNNYTYYCWEKSTDGINWSGTGVCGSKVPILVNGEWVYVVDTTFIPVAADSGTYFRLKVATTPSNLTNSSCSVANSQKIFAKIYNVTCSLLNTKLLDFSGNIIGEKAALRWTSEYEANLQSYLIEKSTDGINFYQAGAIEASNSPNGSSYVFKDPGLISNLVYYRLKLIPTNGGNQVYSKIITLYNKNTPLKINAVNPFNDNIQIKIFLPEDGNVKFNLYNIYGENLTQRNIQLIQGNSQFILDGFQSLPPGLYVLRAVFNNNIAQNKLIKL